MEQREQHVLGPRGIGKVRKKSFVAGTQSTGMTRVKDQAKVGREIQQRSRPFC